jgi:uncharacterized protein YbjQ (UPF0145 family)
MADDQQDAPIGAADARLERLRRAGAWGSLLSVQEFAAIAGAGFDPVGDVLGTAVVHLGYAGQGGRCSGTPSYTPRTDLASAVSGPLSRMLRQRYGVRRLALSRAVQECTALGGDGIVGVKLNIRPFPAGGTEFTIQGTAVRARAGTRLAAPFTSHLSGQEFASLLRAGWVPAALVFAVSLGARHDDLRTRDQARLTAASREIRGYGELVKDVRRDARDQLERAVTAQGADGVVASELTLHIDERECPAVEGSRDHMAEAAILGTSIAAFHHAPREEGRAPLVILPVNPTPVAATGLRPPSLIASSRFRGNEDRVPGVRGQPVRDAAQQRGPQGAAAALTAHDQAHRKLVGYFQYRRGDSDLRLPDQRCCLISVLGCPARSVFGDGPGRCLLIRVQSRAIGQEAGRESAG